MIPYPDIEWSSVFFGIAALILIFLIFREIITWYWKINKIANLLERIEENTRPKEVDDNLNSPQPVVLSDPDQGKDQLS